MLGLYGQTADKAPQHTLRLFIVLADAAENRGVIGELWEAIFAGVLLEVRGVDSKEER